MLQSGLVSGLGEGCLSVSLHDLGQNYLSMLGKRVGKGTVFVPCLERTAAHICFVFKRNGLWFE